MLGNPDLTTSDGRVDPPALRWHVEYLRRRAIGAPSGPQMYKEYKRDKMAGDPLKGPLTLRLSGRLGGIRQRVG